MAKKQLSKKRLDELAKLRADYLAKRTELLQAEVDDLSVILFDKVYEQYLSEIQQSDGVIIYNAQNISMVAGLDKVYKQFALKDNARVIKQFVNDSQGLTEVNETYFKGIQPLSTEAAATEALMVVNKQLGVTELGIPIKNGFTDKFLRDQTLLKKIKKQTTQAIVEKKGFQQFRKELQTTIQGEKDKPLSGGLQQYYRNNAYDTFQKVDRLNSETFADDLGMQWFIWAGGLLPTSRNICIKAHDKFVNSAEFRHLEYKQLKDKYKEGLPNGKTQPVWKPLQDLGGFACIHRKDYVPTEYALLHKDEWLDLASLKK